MNHVGPKFIADNPALRDAILAVKDGQTDEKIMAIYAKLKDQPLVKWKDSVKKIVGLRQSMMPGLDM